MTFLSLSNLFNRISLTLLIEINSPQSWFPYPCVKYNSEKEKLYLFIDPLLVSQHDAHAIYKESTPGTTRKKGREIEVPNMSTVDIVSPSSSFEISARRWKIDDSFRKQGGRNMIRLPPKNNDLNDLPSASDKT